MLFVDTPDEAAAAAIAGIDILSIIDPIWTPEMREAAGQCFVQVGLLYGELCTYEDYLRAAHRAMKIGGDAVYCAAIYSACGALLSSNASNSINRSTRKLCLYYILDSCTKCNAVD